MEMCMHPSEPAMMLWGVWLWVTSPPGWGYKTTCLWLVRLFSSKSQSRNPEPRKVANPLEKVQSVFYLLGCSLLPSTEPRDLF